MVVTAIIANKKDFWRSLRLRTWLKIEFVNRTFLNDYAEINIDEIRALMERSTMNMRRLLL